jgi:hypothetical protein
MKETSLPGTALGVFCKVGHPNYHNDTHLYWAGQMQFQ